MWQKSYDDSPTLYLVPTPIGNLEDITYRAINVLKEVSAIFSEDTRQTAILLNHYNIKNKLICLEEHNENVVKEKVLEYLKGAKSVAIVTDRGTPIISDPGYKTVKFISEQGYNVVSLPGPTAFVPALTSSGIAPQPFLFYGFLNNKESKRRKELKELEKVSYSIIFYEAPHRIIKTLEDMYNIFGNRQISISREISKKFESVYRGTLEDIINNFENVKGEFVIVVEGNINEETEDVDVISLINDYVDKGISVSDAIKKVSKDTNINKNEVYRIYHGGK